jgi:hypothetical protein
MEDWPEDSKENGPLRIIALKCPRVKNGEIKVIFGYIECICLENEHIYALHRR